MLRRAALLSVITGMTGITAVTTLAALSGCGADVGSKSDDATATATGTATAAGTGTATSTAATTATGSGAGTGTGTDTADEFSAATLLAIPPGVSNGPGTTLTAGSATFIYNSCTGGSGYPMTIVLQGAAPGNTLTFAITGTPTPATPYEFTKSPDDVTATLNIDVRYETPAGNGQPNNHVLTNGTVAFGQFALTNGAAVTMAYDLTFDSGRVVGTASAALAANPQGACVVADEPIIYLYPQTTTPVQVRLDYGGTVTASYPALDPKTNGWSVTASPDGKLVDRADGTSYASLFWEGAEPPSATYDLTQGFIVPGKDIKPFLKDKLTRLGLTPHEINEFIVYWYPKMQGNAYNLVHFAGGEYTDHAKLLVTPKPDTVLRVFMVYQPLQHPAQVKEQALAPTPRHGFTVVEWGGSELKGPRVSAAH